MSTELHSSAIKYLFDLISFQSVTPKQAGSIDYIEKLLEAAGFYTVRKVFGHKDCEVTNLYARYGDSSPNICFAGHVDVVPAGDLNLWTYEPFRATRIDDKIYGRGAVDMKGAIACALASTLFYIEGHKNPKGAISFLLTSDEEGDGIYGIREMIQYLKEVGEVVDLAILGEPTSENYIGDTIKIGRRGSINFQLTVNGTQGHVAYPQNFDNPITCLSKILYFLSTMKLDDGTKDFEPSNLEITSVDVKNDTTNLIPASARAQFNVRFNPSHSSESLVALIRQIVEEYSNQYLLTHNCSANSFIQEKDEKFRLFADLVFKTTNISPNFSTNGGTSDARFIKDYCSVVEFGLRSETAHKIDEYTTISDLQKLCDVYYEVLKKLLV